ncbi:hypothetical protein UFOVP257_331 [uncultured Caudovirales phage]|uniref:Uncharacterized protein n=1 Tax=uncultured Caudovirales phage TaxID=2100421 RepID=A0A6J5LPE8_9CAUD|nr:hypothetical protein UFOVP257_331 [uncultured Caudovirales phage]
MHQSNITEGLEQNDLKRLVHDELHIDEFKSKMGKDEDIVVVSFKVTGREPAEDLVNFIEKGYDWVIDADVSSGEMDDGDYIVFVEADREPSVAKNIINMMEDIMNLTGQDISKWRVIFKSNSGEHDLSLESITQNVPLTSEDYVRRFGKPEKELDEMRAAAGVPITTKAPKNDFTQSIRSLAGIL